MVAKPHTRLSMARNKTCRVREWDSQCWVRNELSEGVWVRHLHHHQWIPYLIPTNQWRTQELQLHHLKDLLKSKEVNKRQEWQEWVSSTECQTREMIALQKQEKSWLSFDHQIAMIDYFNLDLGTTDVYITLDLQALCRLWVKNSWWTWSMWWMGLMMKKSLLFDYLDFCLLCTPSSCPYFVVVFERMWMFVFHNIGWQVTTR